MGAGWVILGSFFWTLFGRLFSFGGYFWIIGTIKKSGGSVWGTDDFLTYRPRSYLLFVYIWGAKEVQKAKFQDGISPVVRRTARNPEGGGAGSNPPWRGSGFGDVICEEFGVLREGSREWRWVCDLYRICI